MMASQSDKQHSSCYSHCRVHRCTLDRNFLPQQNTPGDGAHAWKHDSDFTSIAVTGEMLH